jgi:CBS domain-containing protein
MLVREVMTRKTIALRPQDTLREAVRIFAENGISGAPVVDDAGRVLGIITEMDILRRLEIGTMEVSPGSPGTGGTAGTGENGPALRFRTLADALAGTGSLPVSRLMTAPVITARPGDSVQEKAALMVHRRIRRLPVMDGSGRLVGILSRKDLLRMLNSTPSKRRAPARKAGKKGGRGNG